MFETIVLQAYGKWKWLWDNRDLIKNLNKAIHFVGPTKAIPEPVILLGAGALTVLGLVLFLRRRR